MTPNQYQLSIHLVTYNGAKWLPHTFNALTKLNNQDWFLLIIDNNSSDNSLNLINEFLTDNFSIQQRSRLVKNRINTGFARAHNQALHWTESDYVFMLNQDVYLDPNYIEPALKRLELEEDAAAVTGKLWRWYLRPHETEQIIDTVGLKLKRDRGVTDRGQGEVDNNQYSTAEPIFGVSGAAPIFRRAALKVVAVEGQVFDESFVSYKEDVDLAWRLQRAGFSSWYEPLSVGWHDRGLTKTNGGFKHIAREHNKRADDLALYSWVNHWAVIVKNDSWRNLWLDLPLVFWAEAKKFFYYLFFKPKLFFMGIKRLICLSPQYLKWRRQLQQQLLYSPTVIRKWFV